MELPPERGVARDAKTFLVMSATILFLTFLVEVALYAVKVLREL